MDRAEATVVITNEVGLHARPAALFVRKAKEFESNITVQNLTRNGEVADAKSPLGVIKAAISQNHEIHIVAEGPDAQEAVDALVTLVETELA
ncbi:MAG TPA: HPr family phosphocarrier protein [Acidimicrobiia bacterium]